MFGKRVFKNRFIIFYLCYKQWENKNSILRKKSNLNIDFTKKVKRIDFLLLKIEGLQKIFLFNFHIWIFINLKIEIHTLYLYQKKGEIFYLFIQYLSDFSRF